VNIDKFYLYLVIGMMPWIFFSSSIQGGSTCIRASSDMVKKIYFPREVIPISYVTSTFVNMLLSFIIVFLAIIVAGIGVNFLALLYLPLIMIIEYVFTLGLAFIVSSATVYFRDLEQIVGVIMMAWIYLTPIMYDVNYITDVTLQKALFINPMTSIIVVYHDILYYKVIPQTNDLILSSVTAVIVLIFGYLLFTKLERNFAEEL
jgi:ABC-2 type transport system permease protein